MTIPTKTFHNLSKEKNDRIMNAAINEFSLRSFENAMLSNIIKEAKIARGSFYQYFLDKKDLYIHLFNLIGKEKVKYMGEELLNPSDLPFKLIFRELYKTGAKFAIGNPKYVRIFSHLIASHDNIYNELVKDGLEMARQIYIGFINRDKDLGRINKDVDSEVLAELVINMTTNIAINELDLETASFGFERMMERFDKVMYIFEKGILAGEDNV